MTRLAVALLVGVGCASDPALEPAPAPTPAPAPASPPPSQPDRIPGGTPCALPEDLPLAAPTRSVKSPLATEITPELEKARLVLEGIVRDHGRVADNPWAVSHSILALGPEVELTNGQPAIDWLFAEYAEIQEINGEVGLAFPARKGADLVEPHTDLLLKAFTESGISPDREVEVGGQTLTVEALYRRSLCAAWVDGEKVSFQSWNDSPWALQALTTWSPDGLSWTSDGGHAMTMDGFTTASVARLRRETDFLQKVRKSGKPGKKSREGIFADTCGGAHMVQGAAWAVGRGFGTDADRAAIAEEISLHLWRLDLEIESVDPLIASRPDYADLLLIQRVKYLGHALETVHKAAALGLFTPTDEEREQLVRAADELASTVLEIEKRGFVKNLMQIKQKRLQTYLDYIGDSAHALRGIDLHTGVGEVRY